MAKSDYIAQNDDAFNAQMQTFKNGIKLKAKLIAIAMIVIFTMLAKAADKLYDDQLAKDAVAVLRVQLMFSNSTPTNIFTWYLVHVNHVFKNDSNENLMHDFPVGAFNGKDGVPSEECTIYLERYDVLNGTFSKSKTFGSWVLVGGDSTNGVSHVDKHVK